MLCVLSSFSHVQLFATLWTVAHQTLLFHGILQAKNTAVDCHAFLQGIFLTRGLNSCLLRLLHWQGGFFTTSASWEAPTWALPRINLIGFSGKSDLGMDNFNSILNFWYSQG